jgi:hypothetical protein
MKMLLLLGVVRRKKDQGRVAPMGLLKTGLLLQGVCHTIQVSATRACMCQQVGMCAERMTPPALQQQAAAAAGTPPLQQQQQQQQQQQREVEEEEAGAAAAAAVPS